MLKLQEIIKNFDLPEKRIENLDENNLRWLLRNISFRNMGRPDYDIAVEMIKDELRRM